MTSRLDREIDKGVYPVTVTNVQSKGGWYIAEWKITIKRGSGPEKSQLRAADLPDDIREGLTRWLAGQEYD